MRTISPFISLLLITLVLSGSTGFTLIKHTCYHCGVQELFALTVSSVDKSQCCPGHSTGDMTHCHSTGEFEISDDCCTHQSERVVTDELVRTELQLEVIPFFTAAVLIAVIPDNDCPATGTVVNDLPWHHGRDLTTLHCQILS